MSRVVVTMNVTMDGVMQAPGSPDEDRRRGFERGGWALGYDGLVNEYTLLIHPLILGSGRRLFPDGAPARRPAPCPQRTDQHRRHHRDVPAGVAAPVRAQGGPTLPR
jgi:hypothetical protein